MATVSVLEVDMQLHGGSDVLLSIVHQSPRHVIHLLYCSLQTVNNRRNHYDALHPLKNSTKATIIPESFAQVRASSRRYGEKSGRLALI